MTRESVGKATINLLYRLTTDNLKSLAIRLDIRKLAKSLISWGR